MIPPMFDINTFICMDKNHTWMVSNEDRRTKSTYISYMFYLGMRMEYSVYILILRGLVTLILVMSLCILWHSSIVYYSWLWLTCYLYKSTVYIWWLYIYIFGYRQNRWGGLDTMLQTLPDKPPQILSYQIEVIIMHFSHHISFNLIH